MIQKKWKGYWVGLLAICMGLAFGVPVARAQGEGRTSASKTESGASADSLRDLRLEIEQLRTVLKETREEAAQSRFAVAGLRKELQAAKEQLDALRQGLDTAQRAGAGSTGISAESQASSPPPTAAQKNGTMEERVTKLEEDQTLLRSEVSDQSQTKVESAGKYRVRLSGIALLNVFDNRGRADNQDVPSLALARRLLDPAGDFGATARQTELGLEVFGPHAAGAQSSGQLQFDFFGGFPQTLNGTTTGLVRMRTATFRLDWSHTAVVMGQEAPFLSPTRETFGPGRLRSISRGALTLVKNPESASRAASSIRSLVSRPIPSFTGHPSPVRVLVSQPTQPGSRGKVNRFINPSPSAWEHITAVSSTD